MYELNFSLLELSDDNSGATQVSTLDMGRGNVRPDERHVWERSG